MSSYTEIFMNQGATFSNIINIKNNITNTPINVSGYIVTSQMRRSFYSANVSANIDCTITSASNGQITMSMTAANTANIKAGRYVFDVKAIDTANVTSRLLEGMIIVTPQVTK